MLPRFDYGEAVRVVRNVRNDGTYPGMQTGDLLIRRGSVGYVRNVGTFLQDQLIYEVHFIDDDCVVGCRDEELIGADEPWVPSRYEFRDYVCAAMPLSIGGRMVVEQGAEGQVMRVLRGQPGGVAYHVRFPGRTLQVPEGALEPAGPVRDLE